MKKLTIFGVERMPEVKNGDDIAKLIIQALGEQEEKLYDGDIVLVTSKIVSKAEGQVIFEKDVTPSSYAINLADFMNKDPAQIEVILRETSRPIKVTERVLIMETKHGLICANAGVDESNTNAGELLILPEDSDQSALHIRKKLENHYNIKLAVIITDTFGRPWRMGQTNVAIGVSGMEPLLSYNGVKDRFGRELKSTLIAIADQIAGASELVMGKIDHIPVGVIRGYQYEHGERNAKELIRPENQDLFR